MTRSWAEMALSKSGVEETSSEMAFVRGNLYARVWAVVKVRQAMFVNFEQF